MTTMSVELLADRWYITTACPEAHADGQPCASCWPCTGCNDGTHSRAHR